MVRIRDTWFSAVYLCNDPSTSPMGNGVRGMAHREWCAGMVHRERCAGNGAQGMGDGNDDGKGEVIWETIPYGHRGSWCLPLEAIWERTHWGDKMPLRPRTPTISASIGQATMSMDGTDDGKGEVIWETILYGHRGSWCLPLEAVWERTHWGDGDLPGARKLAHHHVVKCLTV